MRVCYLSGGVGGARLLRGLAACLPGDQLRAVVNTGDDFHHWGLHVSPDLDTVMYTLAGLSDFARGWGLRDERFEALAMVRRYGGESWFQLGDRDLGTHIMRSAWLREGLSLTEVTARLCRGVGVELELLPMTDAPVETRIHTDDGRALPFQRWFVQERCAPRPTAVTLGPVGDGATPRPTEQVMEALAWADAILIGPSNPYVSIDTILGLPGVAAAVQARPVVAVSPLVAGRAVKGPLAEMMTALEGAEPGSRALAGHYGMLRGLIVDRRDAGDQVGATSIGAADTLMRNPEEATRCARQVLQWMEAWCS